MKWLHEAINWRQLLHNINMFPEHHIPKVVEVAMKIQKLASIVRELKDEIG